MRAVVIVSACVLLRGTATADENPPEWQPMARQDVEGIHDALVASHPAVYVDKDSAHFRDWLETGYRAALADLPKVRGARGYYYLLRGYTGGFRDSHITVSMKAASGIGPAVIAWPGIATAWRGGHYMVAYVDEARRAELPPVGARLIACDDRSAERIARDRLDRFEANLDLEGGRYFSAPRLLWDLGNPFVGQTPSSCTFGVSGSPASYKLRYSAPSGDLSAAIAAAAGHTRPELAVEKWKDGWWIGLPSMLGDQHWEEFFAGVESHRDEIRSAPYVVLDVRGNPGGDSEYPERLAHILWGDALVRAYAPDIGDEVYRVSEVNRKFFSDALRQFAETHEVNEYVQQFTELVSKMDAALAAGQPLVVIHHQRPNRPRTLPPNPMKGRIVLLTDYVCNSACLDMMDLYRRLPGTVQAGVSTFADTIFMEISRVDLPSGRATLSFGHKAWIERPRGSNVVYRPSPKYTYGGDLGDDAAIRTWVANVVLDGLKSPKK